MLHGKRDDCYARERRKGLVEWLKLPVSKAAADFVAPSVAPTSTAAFALSATSRRQLFARQTPIRFPVFVGGLVGYFLR